MRRTTPDVRAGRCAPLTGAVADSQQSRSSAACGSRTGRQRLAWTLHYQGIVGRWLTIRAAYRPHREGSQREGRRQQDRVKQRIGDGHDRDDSYRQLNQDDESPQRSATAVRTEEPSPPGVPTARVRRARRAGTCCARRCWRTPRLVGRSAGARWWRGWWRRAALRPPAVTKATPAGQGTCASPPGT